MIERDEETHAALIREQFTKQAAPFAALGIHTHGESLQLLERCLRLRGHERLLDAGCGPGLLLRHFAPLAREVVGLDATDAMLDKARALCAERALGNVSFHAGDMETLPFPAASFDAVVTRYTFHHLLHPQRALTELVRVCRPGGRVVVCDATPKPEARGAYDAWERLRDASHASALTEQELVAFAGAELDELEIARFRLLASVDELLASSFPSDVPSLYARMQASVSRDELDMQPYYDGEKLMMSFPVSVVAGTRRS